MKMLEEILQNGVAGNLDLEGLREAAEDGLEVFLIQNVAEYLYAQTDQEEWDVMEDFPCLAPPFPVFWMEFSRPSKIVSTEYGVMGANHMPYRTGFLFQFQRLDQIKLEGDEVRKRLTGQRQMHADYMSKNWSAEIEAELCAFKNAGGNSERLNELSPKGRAFYSSMLSYASLETVVSEEGLNREIEAFRNSGTYWLMDSTLFMQRERHQPIHGPLLRQQLQVDKEGVARHKPVAGLLNLRADMPVEIIQGLQSMWFPALLAISFCHCRNVAIQVEPKDRALQKAQQKAGRPVLVYKRLEISPLRATLRDAGAEAHNGLKRALHICRGHFAVYQDKGLFGKYKGRFWIPQHVRGSTDAGLVIKDYQVKGKI